MALEQAFCAVVPDLTVTTVVKGDLHAERFMADLGEEIKRLDWHRKSYEAAEIASRQDIVIIDSYTANAATYEIIASCGCDLVVMIDDNNRMIYPPGIVVSPSVYGDQLSYPPRPGVTYLAGAKFVILRKEFWQVPEPFVRKQVENVLVFLGGSTASNKLANQIPDWCTDWNEIHFEVVDSGKNQKSAGEMIESMTAADICITGGGQTSEELACVGTPAVGICMAENQLQNLDFLAARNFIEFVGWHTQSDLRKKVRSAVAGLSPIAVRSRRSIAAVLD